MCKKRERDTQSGSQLASEPMSLPNAPLNAHWVSNSASIPVPATVKYRSLECSLIAVIRIPINVRTSYAELQRAGERFMMQIRRIEMGQTGGLKRDELSTASEECAPFGQRDRVGDAKSALLSVGVSFLWWNASPACATADGSSIMGCTASVWAVHSVARNSFGGPT